MDYYSMTEAGILKELGNRIRHKRLRGNISQIGLAAKAGVSIRVIQNIEYGNPSTISGFLRVLRALKSLDHLDDFLPIARFTPLEIVKMEKKKRRQRASRAVRGEGS